MPLLIQVHTLVKELVQYFWMMWLALEMRLDLLTASPLPVTTVHTVMMLVSVAKMNVGSLPLCTVNSLPFV